jgi:hypothetical protein
MIENSELSNNYQFLNLANQEKIMQANFAAKRAPEIFSPSESLDSAKVRVLTTGA